MNIHYVTPHFYPDLGGVEDHVVHLAKYMIEKGHEVTVHTSRISLSGKILPTQDDVHGILVKRYSPRFSLGYYFTTFKPRIGEGEILHAHGYAFLPNDFALRHYRGRMGTLYTMHHGVRMIPPNLRAKILRILYDRYGIGTLKRVDRIITFSDADRRWLVAKRIPNRKIELVPVGITEEAFQPGIKKAILKHGLQNYIIFLGRVHKEKCVDHLLEAVARLKRDLQVAIVGPDEGAMIQLRKKAQDLGISDVVKFLGRVSDEEKRDLIARSKVLVLPSLYEGQGTVIIEAWAQGKPVIASRVGGIPELVQDEVNGILYDWGNIEQLTASIKKVIDDDTLARKFGESGKKTAMHKYHTASIGARIENIYTAVMSERPWRHKR